jgi:drug/metabolite transporter (DMT)-like permease
LTSSAANRRGIVAMLAAMTMFTGNDALLKLASATYPPGEIMALRGVFATLIALGAVAASGELSRLRRLGSPRVLLRATVEAAVAFLFITSLAVLPLANITAIIQTTPIIMTAMTVALGIERVRWQGWGAILVGFAGVVMIVKPSAAAFDVFALLAVATAALVAVRDLITRTIGPQVPSLIVTLSTTIAVAGTGFLIGAVEDWRPLATYELTLLVGAAVLVSIGNLGVIVAFRGSDVSVVSPFRYCNVPLAIVLGMIVFGELPDALSLTGIMLIVGSGLWTIQREQARRSRARELAPARPADAGE